jgi:PAS domain S-box-containing protein/diguanylate cyclase (GGDEF)-like protein
MNSIKTDSTSSADIILIADSPQDKLLLTRMLSDNGYQLRQASTVDLAFAAVKIKKPDLFIVSDQVAGIDGFELCGMLKTAPETKAIPIIMIVGSEQSKRKITRSQYNRVDFVARPYQQDDILIRVQNNLTMHYLYKELAQRNRSLLKEIDGHEQTELLLQLERDRLQTMLQAIGDGVIYTDTAATVTLLNEAAKSFTGWLMEDAIGQPVEKVFKLVKENTREKYEDLVKNVLEAGRPYDVESGALVVSKDGNETPVDVSITPVYLRKGIIDGVAVVFRDYVKEKKKLKNRVFLDHYDQINGRYSRRNSDNELRRLGDSKYMPLSFVVVDVNGLGRTNNSFGGKYSDLMLRKIANILKTECRPDDIVVRIGESKFVIFVPSTDAKYADLMIARLNKAVEKQSIRNVVFTLSVDFSLDGDIYDHIDILLKKRRRGDVSAYQDRRPKYQEQSSICCNECSL